MKKLMTGMFSALLTFSCFAADTGLSPSSLKLMVYKFSVSTDPLCTNPVTVIDNGTTPVEVDFTGGVNLGSGPLEPGTYPCVIVEFNSNIRFMPSSNSTSTNCNSNDYETNDVCRSPDTSLLADGTTTTCTSGGDRVAMYLSTASTSTGNVDAFNPPTSGADASHGFKLASSLRVSNAASGKFVVNPTGKICDDNDASCDGGPGGTGIGTGSCKLEPPTFSFTQL